MLSHDEQGTSVVAVGNHGLRIEPLEIHLTVNGQARVRVSGRGYGLLRCGTTTYWVWGAFSKSLAVDRGHANEIVLYELFGTQRSRPKVVSAVDVRTVRVPRVKPVGLSFIPYRVPRVRRLRPDEIRETALADSLATRMKHE